MNQNSQILNKILKEQDEMNNPNIFAQMTDIVSQLEHFKSHLEGEDEEYQNQFWILLAKQIKLQKFEEGDLIFSKNEKIDKIYFILEGQVSLWQQKNDKELNQEINLNKLIQGKNNNNDLHEMSTTQSEIEGHMTNTSQNQSYHEKEQIDKYQAQLDSLRCVDDLQFLMTYQKQNKEFFPRGQLCLQKCVKTLKNNQTFGEIPFNCKMNRLYTALAQKPVILGYISLENYLNIVQVSQEKLKYCQQIIMQLFPEAQVEPQLSLSHQVFEQQLDYNQTLISEGDINRYIYIVNEGQVKLQKNISSASNKQLSNDFGIIGHHQIFGYEDLYSKRSSYTVKGDTEHTIVYMINKNILIEILKNNDDTEFKKRVQQLSNKKQSYNLQRSNMLSQMKKLTSSKLKKQNYMQFEDLNLNKKEQHPQQQQKVHESPFLTKHDFDYYSQKAKKKLRKSALKSQQILLDSMQKKNKTPISPEAYNLNREYEKKFYHPYSLQNSGNNKQKDQYLQSSKKQNNLMLSQKLQDKIMNSLVKDQDSYKEQIKNKMRQFYNTQNQDNNNNQNLFNHYCYEEQSGYASPKFGGCENSSAQMNSGYLQIPVQQSYTLQSSKMKKKSILSYSSSSQQSSANIPKNNDRKEKKKDLQIKKKPLSITNLQGILDRNDFSHFPKLEKALKKKIQKGMNKPEMEDVQEEELKLEEQFGSSASFAQDDYLHQYSQDKSPMNQMVPKLSLQRKSSEHFEQNGSSKHQNQGRFTPKIKQVQGRDMGKFQSLQNSRAMSPKASRQNSILSITGQHIDIDHSHLLMTVKTPKSFMKKAFQ